MIIQKSYFNTTSTLYLVPTPIGNFQDMSYRAVEILNYVDFVFAEDTRVTKVLLSHFNITTTLYSYHIYNEEIQVEGIIKLLKEEKNIALVSDAGMPCISDPGYLVSKAAIDAGFNVISLPGANAALTALVASGIASEKFIFYGFLNHKVSQKEKELKALIDFPYTLIFYEAPHRIKETLEVILKVFGNREIVVARELTKKYEEYVRGLVEDIIKANHEFKGEIVIVVNGAVIKEKQMELLKLEINQHYQYYLDQGYESKEAMKLVAKDRRLSKSEIYKQIIKTDR